MLQPLSDAAISELSTNSKQQEFYDPEFRVGGSFGVRVSSSGGKAFFVVFPIHGKRKRMTIGKFPAIQYGEARAKALEIVRLAGEGRDPATEKKLYRKAETVAELAEIFLSRHVARSLKDSTGREYKRVIEREIVPLWGDLKIRDITPADILEVLEQIGLERGSAVMAARTKTVLGSMFKFAEQRKLIPISPVRELQVHVSIPQKDRVLSPEELKLMWESLEKEQALTSAIFKMLLFTGQKPGVVCAMRWNDINVDWWAARIEEGAAVSSHRIFLPPQAVAVLREVQELNINSEWVFPSRRGGHIQHIRHAATRIAARMDSHPAWNALDIRRTVEHELRKLQVRADVVEKILDRKTLLRVKTPASRSLPEPNYDAEIRSALSKWTRQLSVYVGITPKPQPEPTGSNVVSLFPRDRAKTDLPDK